LLYLLYNGKNVHTKKRTKLQILQKCPPKIFKPLTWSFGLPKRAFMQNSRTWKNEYESSRKGFLELLFLVFCSLALRFLKSKALKVFKIL